MTGKIFDIQRFSVYDGPGARTVVFFKGCNLRCHWCHNPESILKHNQIVFHEERCIDCRRCLKICPKEAICAELDQKGKRDQNKCIECYQCVDECFAKALTVIGKDISAQELLEEILVDYDYFDSGKGGVTFSGGECMLQIDFLAEVLTLCKQYQINTAIDTAGNVPWTHFEKINDLTDVFLYDIKAAREEVHKKLTATSNHQIIENLRQLSNINKKIIVRIPFVIGANETEQAGIIDILKPLQLHSVEILPYHNMGNSKLDLFGKKDIALDYQTPSAEEVAIFKHAMKMEGIPVI